MLLAVHRGHLHSRLATRVQQGREQRDGLRVGAQRVHVQQLVREAGQARRTQTFGSAEQLSFNIP
jgi:hypothetical protein